MEYGGWSSSLPGMSNISLIAHTKFPCSSLSIHEARIKLVGHIHGFYGADIITKGSCAYIFIIIYSRIIHTAVEKIYVYVRSSTLKF